MNYKYLFFDLDRTLWDYDANSSSALSMVYDEFKLDRHFSSREDFLKIYNRNNDILWEDYRNGKVMKEDLRIKRFEDTLQAGEIYNRAFSEEIGERYMYITPRLNTLTPHAVETLEYLTRQNYRLYILTNGFLETQKKKMTHSSIDNYFIRIFSSEELGVNKPRREIFHWAVSSIHARKKECLMIGDDADVDIRGAINYGMDNVWFNPGKVRTELRPTYIIQDIGELTSIL
ncbi:MAG: YjjG family noncanonical pyrimidine nucleotidase [Bacteroidales bacterium]